MAIGMRNKYLKRRIIELSYKFQLGHVGSCLSSVDIIDEIYKIKKPDEKVIISNGHAHLAHAVVKEKYDKTFNIEDIWEKQGVNIHCDRNQGCDVSTGSLGLGLPIALGIAFSDRTKNTYCLISDGECSEGSIFESLRIVSEFKVKNLRVFINYNHWAAFKPVESLYLGTLESQVQVREFDATGYPKWVSEQVAHYKIMSDDEYKEMLEVLN